MIELFPFPKDYFPIVEEGHYAAISEQLDLLKTVFLFRKLGIDVYSFRRNSNLWLFSEDYRKIYIANGDKNEAEDLVNEFIENNRTHFLKYIAKERIEKL